MLEAPDVRMIVIVKWQNVREKCETESKFFIVKNEHASITRANITIKNNFLRKKKTNPYYIQYFL